MSQDDIEPISIGERVKCFAGLFINIGTVTQIQWGHLYTVKHDKENVLGIYSAERLVRVYPEYIIGNL